MGFIGVQVEFQQCITAFMRSLMHLVASVTVTVTKRYGS